MRLLLISTFTALLFSLYFNYSIYQVNTERTYAEISQSCETGYFFYSVKYMYNSSMSTEERYAKNRFISNICGDFARNYLEELK